MKDTKRYWIRNCHGAYAHDDDGQRVEFLGAGSALRFIRSVMPTPGIWRLVAVSEVGTQALPTSPPLPA